MKKRIFCLILSLVMMVGLLPAGSLTASAATAFDSVVAYGYCGGEGDGKNLQWGLTQDGTLVIGGDGVMRSFAGEAAPWKEYFVYIQKVDIFDGVQTIGDYAFTSYGNLKEVVIPDSVQTIGDYAFSYCGNLEEVLIPDSVQTIGENAFAGCQGLTGLTLGSGLRTIGDFAFDNCTALTEVALPNSVRVIGARAFADCETLEKLTIGSGVEMIGDQAFCGCSSLGKAVIPDQTTSIGDGAFKNCTSLRSVTIGAGVEKIGASAFEYCQELRYVELPFGVKTIRENTFFRCAKMTEITIPASVRTIENNAFDGCDLLDDIYYGGVRSQWDTITIGENNEELHIAILHCAELPKLTIVGANMTLGSELKINFLIKKSDVKAGYKAVVTQEGRQPVEAELWSYNKSYYAASYVVAAKEMTDVLSCEIYDADGNPVSNPFTRTIKQYAMTLLGNAASQKQLKTVLVDMLNYGTEAQLYFYYRTDKLANGDVTAEQQKQYATGQVFVNSTGYRGENYAGSSLSLESDIILNACFNTSYTDDLTATVSFTNYLGEEIEVQAEVKPYRSNMVKVAVDEIVLADTFVPVMVTLYKGDIQIGYGVDSVVNYLFRIMESNQKLDQLGNAIIKFAVSANVYLSAT